MSEADVLDYEDAQPAAPTTSVQDTAAAEPEVEKFA